MLLPISWIKNYVNIDDIETMELTDEFTLTGTHVESVMDLKTGIENVVVGKVLEIKEHPNADKLVVVNIDTGDKVHEIVTGAKNMKVDDLVAIAKLGAKLPNGLEIKETELMGIPSPGMLCSYEELGFNKNLVPKNSENGIMILKGDIPLGTNILDVLDMNDALIELEITPNRADCLSMVGLAREIAATFDRKMEMPDTSVEKEVEDIKEYFDGVEIETDNCPRYVARVVKDVVIKESPQWMQNYLMQAGMRPINNIVDITNYVMLELGQPMHAFDINTITNKKIVVRQAKDGEVITTLDKEDRKLTSEDIVIANGDTPVAIAGVMGGLNSEIEEYTDTILIESASFNKSSVRKTAKRLNLRTESSQRFEKGLSPELCHIAADRVCQLIEQTNSGTVIKNSYDNYRVKQEPTFIKVDYKRINKLLGTDIEKETMIHYLENLEFIVKSENDILDIEVPYYRLDVSIPEDIVEEVGRMYGFHNIKPQPLVGALTRGTKSWSRQVVDEMTEIMYGLGLLEATTYSFISPKLYKKIGLEVDKDKLVILRNPLGEDYSVMRTTLVPNMMEILEKNNNYKIDSLKIYEIGNSFFKVENNELPEERLNMVIGMYGNYDFYDLKDIVNVGLSQLGISDLEYSACTDNKTFHPGRCAEIFYKGEKLGIMGEISFDVMDNYHMNQRVYIAEIDFERVVELATFDKKYDPIIKYPSIKRDIAIIVDKNLETATIEKVISDVGEGLIKDVKLFDIYTGEHVEEDKKSLAYSIIYQSSERTLKDKEINNIQEKVLEELESKFGAKLRK